LSDSSAEPAGDFWEDAISRSCASGAWVFDVGSFAQTLTYRPHRHGSLGLLARLLQDRFMIVWIECFTFGFDFRAVMFFKHGAQLFGDHSNTLQQTANVRIRFGRLDRSFDIIKNRKQVVH